MQLHIQVRIGPPQYERESKDNNWMQTNWAETNRLHTA